MATWNKYIAVFNTNPGGNVVARLVSVTTNELNLSETQILESARRKIIQKVQDSLPEGHNVVGVSNIMPSQYGQGGAYIFPIKIIPPQPPETIIEMGPAIKSLWDMQIDEAEHDPSHYGY